jgi:nucleoside-diphosphate-sugar epimerase
MRVIVTGSSGFIGQTLERVLVNGGHEVLGIDRVRTEGLMGRTTHETCDVLDRIRLMEKFKVFAPNAVVHLAARTDLSETRDLSGYAANIEGVRNVVAAVEATGGIERAIFASSQLVCHVGYVPTSETDYAPTTLYGESKVWTERIVRETDGGKTTWCLVRPTTVWGPGMSAHYRRFLRMIANGRYFHVGTSPLRKSYGYIGSVVHQIDRLLFALAEAVHRKTLYLADEPPLSLREWADTIQREMGAPPIRTVPVGLARLLARAGDAVNGLGFRAFPFNSFRLNNLLTEYRFDLSETLRICGPSPFSMEQGVRELVRWFQGRDA